MYKSDIKIPSGIKKDKVAFKKKYDKQEMGYLSLIIPKAPNQKIPNYSVLESSRGKPQEYAIKISK